MSKHVVRFVGLLAMFYLMTLSAVAQGTPADYARAVGLRDKYEGAAVDITGTIAPIGQTHR